MNFTKRQLFILGGGAVAVLAVGFFIYTNLLPSKGVPVRLTMWGFEEKTVFGAAIQHYTQTRPNVTIDYRQVPRANYESYLLDALASGSGPDIFPLHNRALPKERHLLAPVYPQQFTVAQLENLFPSVVEQDFAFSTSSAAAAKQIYALPLSLDTLALIYNKGWFDQAGIANPPKTWTEFQSVIPKLRALSPTGQLIKAGAAIGGSAKTIPTAADLLNALMLQNGTIMTAPDFKSASFASGQTGAAGLGAFNFYLQFANTASPLYAWNDTMGDARESFSNGTTAVLFDYASSIPKLTGKNPFLKVGVAPFPQPADAAQATTYPDYWGLAVSSRSQATGWAWDFIVYATTNTDATRAYSQAAGSPPALRSLIGETADGSTMGIFAKQALTASSWYDPDETRVSEIFGAAIDNVLSSRFDSRKALQQAQDQVSQLLPGS